MTENINISKNKQFGKEVYRRYRATFFLGNIFYDCRQDLKLVAILILDEMSFMQKNVLHIKNVSTVSTSPSRGNQVDRSPRACRFYSDRMTSLFDG